MIFDKISIFVFLILSTIYTSESRNLSNHYTDLDRNCVCFEGHGPNDIKVPQIIQPKQGLERLVLFTYEDVVTKQIIIHIPSLETQNLVPDLPFRNEDELIPLFNEPISSILTRSPHKTYIQENNEPFHVKATPSKNLDIVKVADENNVPNVHKVNDQRHIQYVTPDEYSDNWIDNVQFNNINVKQTDDQQPVYVTPEENSDNTHNIPYDYINVDQDQQPIYYTPKGFGDKWIDTYLANYVNGNQVGDQQPLHVTPAENNDKWKHNVSPNYISIKQINDQQPIYAANKVNNDKWTDNIPFNYVNIKGIHNQQPIDLPDIEFHEDRHELTHNVPVNYLKYLKQIANQPDRGNIVQAQSPVILKYPLVIPENPQTVLKYPKISPSHPQQLQGQFSEWITKQINNINHHKYRGIPNIDVSSIENSILRLLYDNGMYVTDKGALIDSHGTVLDTHILNLRLILVGNTIPLDILQRNGESLSSQESLPYIKAILVTTPQKVLGVLPLGKTYLSLSTLNTLPTLWENNPEIEVGKNSYLPSIRSLFDYLKFDNISGNNVKDGRRDKKKTMKSNDIRYDLGKHDSQDSYDKDPDPRSRPKNNNKKHSLPSEQTIKIKQNKNITREQDDETEKYDRDVKNVPIEGSNNINGNDNEDIVRRSTLDQPFYPRREVIPRVNAGDDLFSKRLIVKDLTSLDQKESYSNQGRHFLPDMDISNDPLEIISKIQHLPLDLLWHNNDEGIHVPGLMPDFMDILFGRKNTPVTSVKRRNYIAGDVPKLVSAESNGIPIYSVKGRQSEPIKTLENISQVNTRRPRIPNLSDLDLFNPVFPEQQELLSRSGITVPKEAGKSNSIEEVSTFLMENDYDDDEGDFRIIGGNAATGSGTPLSNRGRSGNLH